MLIDNHAKYGLISKTLHWLSALLIIGLFAIGYWMVDLSYYSEWYKTAPHWHKSVGILLLCATVFRLLWRAFTPSPQPIKTQSVIVQTGALITHRLLYLMLVLILISGYMISTADGRSIEVFSWFEVPALGSVIDNQEDIAGEVHKYLAYGLIGLVILHAIAALKHHIIDKDATLTRMIR